MRFASDSVGTGEISPVLFRIVAVAVKQLESGIQSTRTVCDAKYGFEFCKTTEKCVLEDIIPLLMNFVFPADLF